VEVRAEEIEVTAEAVNADSLMAARIRQALKCEGVIKHE
jgi:hypothetical protein